jgi:hypothetical protein
MQPQAKVAAVKVMQCHMSHLHVFERPARLPVFVCGAHYMRHCAAPAVSNAAACSSSSRTGSGQQVSKSFAQGLPQVANNLPAKVFMYCDESVNQPPHLCRLPAGSQQQSQCD